MSRSSKAVRSWVLLGLAGLLAACSDPETIGFELGAEGPVDIEEFVEFENVLAYAVADDAAIYVAPGFEEEVAEALGASVVGNTWTLKEPGGAQPVQREKKPASTGDWYRWPAIVVWTYLRGLKCTEVSKGTMVNIVNKRGGVVAQYRTPEDGAWCMANKRATCKVVWKTVTGQFLTASGWRTQTRRLSACS